FIAYFQPYTNTYADVDTLHRLYSEALAHPQVIGLAIGTRPDTVDAKKIELLSTYTKDYFVLIEYGLQSIYDHTLIHINRGHDYQCFLDALNLTTNKGIHIGAHIIAGFPTEELEQTLAMAEVLSELPINFLKIHQLQVIKETRMADIYNDNPFPIFTYDQYLDFLVNFIEKLSPNIVLQRLFATAPDNILIAPLWDRQRQNIIRDIDKRFKRYATFQGKYYLEGAALKHPQGDSSP
ncbi:MAG: TIGR01212 family radical SAM protein, partial [Nitrospirae bacterium]|nr:TIGR01212 family radical SAM protein [Nitrospirota bacterium]